MRVRSAILSLIFLAFLAVGLYPFASSALTSDEIKAQIQSMLVRIAELKAVLDTLAKNAAVTKQASAPAALCFSLARTLSIGSGGEDVRDLQSFLIKAGVLSLGNATGYFGPLTEAAVRAWQSAHGIVSAGDAASTGFGVVGPKTRAALLTGCSSVQGALATASPIPSRAVVSPTSTAVSASPGSAGIVVSLPSIAISAPRGGAGVAGSNTLRIAWGSSNAPSSATVSLFLIDEGGKNVGTIAQGVNHSGEYLWRVPEESSDCSSGGNAFDCIMNIAGCKGSMGICTLAPGTYRIMATLSNLVSTTSPPFQVVGSAKSNLLEALLGAPFSSSSIFNTSSASSSTSAAPGMCVHEGQHYAPGTTLSVPCEAGHCPSSSSGTGFVAGTCVGGEWCIPYTAYCAPSFTAIDVSAYEGGGAGAIKSGYSISCPQEGYRAYLSCPYGGCETGWNTCRGGAWVRDLVQQIFPVGTQGPCQTGNLWCGIGGENGYGCVPSSQCVDGNASI